MNLLNLFVREASGLASLAAASASARHGSLLPWIQGDAYPAPGGATGVYGVIEGAEIMEGVVTLRRWASDLGRHKPVSRVLVLVNGQVVRAVKPWLHRMDVATVHGPAHLVSGFRIDFKTTQDNSILPRQIVVIAVDAQNELLAELSWPHKSCLLAHAVSTTGDRKRITAIAAEQARGWWLQTSLEQSGPSACKRERGTSWPKRWFLRRRAEPELKGRIHEVERVDNFIMSRGSVFEIPGKRVARWVEIYTGVRLLGRTGVGLWQGDAILEGRGYGAFTALIPAEWIEDALMANVRVRAVSSSGHFEWLSWSGEDALARHHAEPSFSPGATPQPTEVKYRPDPVIEV